jgi:hypothetical protein
MKISPFLFWCLGPESNRHAAFGQAADFKSAVSTYFTTEASASLWRIGKTRYLEARPGVEPS